MALQGTRTWRKSMEHDAPGTGSRGERLEEVADLIRTRVVTDQADLLAAFARQYFGQVDPEDLADRQVADLYGAALSLASALSAAALIEGRATGSTVPGFLQILKRLRSGRRPALPGA